MKISSASVDEYATLTQPSDDLIPADPAVPGGYQLEAAFVGLRERILSLQPDRTALEQLGNPPVVAVLMETGYDSFVVTLVAIADGTASIYFSRGPMIVGTGEKPAVRAAALAMLNSAAAYIPKCLAAKSYPLPSRGRVRFYIVTSTRVYTVQANEHELEHRGHAFSELFCCGHRLMYAIRAGCEGLPPLG